MFRKTEKSFQYHPGIEQIISDVIGGGTIDRADLNVSFGGVQLDELPPLVPVGQDSNTGVWHVVKTAKIVAGGSNSAPRLAKNHLFKVGDIISDGVVALEISAVTKTETEYDTLGFTSGTLSIFAVDTVLYAASAIDLTGSGKVATATVQDTAGDFLVCSAPVVSTPEIFNGITLKIEQAADDVLAVAYDAGILTISLAKTTAANNNIAAIQALVRALGTVEGIDWSAVIFSGTDWDDKQTGATLTTATDLFDGGVNGAIKAYKYTPEAITMNKVDLTVANQQSGLLEAGKVNESVMPFPVNAALKAVLKDIRFV